MTEPDMFTPTPDWIMGWRAGKAEATAAAEQRLRERIEALRGKANDAVQSLPPSDRMFVIWLAQRDAYDAVLELLDTPPPVSPRQGEPVEELDELAGKAGEYIEAVVAYLDPANQFTHSRRRHVDRTGEELAELVAAALSEPAEAGERVDVERAAL